MRGLRNPIRITSTISSPGRGITADGAVAWASRSAKFLSAATPQFIFARRSRYPGLNIGSRTKAPCRSKKRCSSKPAATTGCHLIPRRLPREAQTKNLYYHENGKLSFDAHQTDYADASETKVSDPAHPVPYRHRPIDMTYPEDHPGSWYTWLVEDQRFVDERPDVLTWQTEELAEDVTLAGQVTAKLFASTTGSDSDWIVKLIDVYPQKYAATTGNSQATN